MKNVVKRQGVQHLLERLAEVVHGVLIERIKQMVLANRRIWFIPLIEVANFQSLKERERELKESLMKVKKGSGEKKE